MWLVLSILLSVQVFAGGPDDEDTRNAIAAAEAISHEIDRTLVELEPARHAMVWTEGVVGLIRKYPFVDFYLLENRLRRLGARTFLIAAPMTSTEANYCSRSLTRIPSGDLKYYLWVEVNGPGAAELKMREFGIESPEQNLENLKQTGLLVIRNRH